MAERPRGEASTVLRVHSRVRACVQGGPHLDGAVLDVSVCRRELRDGRRGFGGRGYAHSTAPPRLHRSHHAHGGHGAFLCSFRVILGAGGPGSRGRAVAGWWPRPF